MVSDVGRLALPHGYDIRFDSRSGQGPGSAHNVTNYRPISVLCCLAKTLELLIHDKFYGAAKPIISQRQHGFVKNRSTATNLMAYASFLNSSLDKRCQVDSVYVDIAKAFDRVLHELTLKKLEKLGFPN